MKVYIMRHGKTDWNALFKCQGQTDIPLNEEGRKMAREARERYKDLKYDVCFTSPLVRARETAEIITAGRNVEIIPDDRLKEINLGIYSGEERVLERPGSPLYDFFMAPDRFTADPSMESFEALYARGKDFVDNVLVPLKDKYDAVLIVAHAAINRAIFNPYREIPVSKFWELSVKNCEITEIEI